MLCITLLYSLEFLKYKCTQENVYLSLVSLVAKIKLICKATVLFISQMFPISVIYTELSYPLPNGHKYDRHPVLNWHYPTCTLKTHPTKVTVVGEKEQLVNHKVFERKK